MKREDVIRMARESGMSFHLGMPHETVMNQLGQFAALVAAAEREECAKVCDPYTHGQWFADAIRARGTL